MKKTDNEKQNERACALVFRIGRFSFAAAMVVGMAGTAYAYNWTGGAGDFQLDKRGNWESESSSANFIVNQNPGQPFTVGGDGDFFGGKMLRYSGDFTVTNDFGAAGALTNLGMTVSGSAFHVESGAKLVQKSGGLRAFKTTYISDDKACFMLDGADAWFVQESGSLLLRSQGFDYAVRPMLIVTNGASLTVKSDMQIGVSRGNVSAYVCAVGAGSRIAANKILIGDQEDRVKGSFTNLLAIADSAEASINSFTVGYDRSNSGCEVVGGTVTVSNSFTLSRVTAASNCWMRIASGGTFTNLGTTAIGRAEVGNNARVYVSGAGSSFVGLGASTLNGGVFRVEDSGTAQMTNTLDITDGRIESVGDNSSFSVSGRMNANGTNVVEGILNYSTIYMNSDFSELTFTNATVTGTRIEMTKPSTIRLYNTHLTLPSGLFMMGDGGGNDPVNNAYKRDVYVGGTDTWVRVNASNGFYVRGTNTTIHVEIPAEGFSTSHPVFDLPKIYFQTGRRLRVEVTVDPKIKRDGSVYTLFRTSADDSCQSSSIDWVYDPQVIDIVKSGNNEVRVRVKRQGFMITVH